MPMPALYPLIPHPDTPAPWVAGLMASARRRAAGGIELVYHLSCAPGRLRLPAAGGGRADGLWRHTCFEAFVAGAGAEAYREFNFAPSGQWQAHAFSAWRAGGPLVPATPPAIRAEHAGAGGLILRAGVAGADLPTGRRLRIALTAVIEDMDGHLSYWALRHPPGRPDFHHPDGRALELTMGDDT